MKAPVRNFIIRDATGSREAETLVIGRAIQVGTTAGGLPELVGPLVGETQLVPSGGDDTQAIRDALARSGRVRLGAGEFVVSGTITVGTGQSVVGCGSARVTVRSTHAGAVFMLGNDAAIEELTISGPGTAVVGGVGVTSSSGAEVCLRRVTLKNLGQGVQLTGVTRATLEQITVKGAGSYGILASGSNLMLLDVSVSGADTGLYLGTGTRIACVGASVSHCRIGVQTNQVSTLLLQAVRISSCSQAAVFETISDGEISSISTFECEVGLLLRNCRGVGLARCSVQACDSEPLKILGGDSISVDSFFCRLIGSQLTPHLVVASGSTFVTIMHFRVGSTWTTPFVPHDVDVSGAGGRVVFIQHNFDPARINSGGNFVAL